MGRGRDDVADDQQKSAGDGDPSTTKEIGQRANEGTGRAKSEQIGEDEPRPSIKTTEFAVNCNLISTPVENPSSMQLTIWRHTTVKIEWNLRTSLSIVSARSIQKIMWLFKPAQL